MSINRAEFEPVLRPVDEARCPPASAYTDEEFLALERRTLFSQRWIFAGLVDDVSDPGDIRPIEVAGRRLLLVRDHDGEVRVFHNYCRHRGLELVDAPCAGRSLITCPYHSWSYALDGRLIRAPHFDGPDRHDARPVEGLDVVSSAIWHRLVFVNLDGNAAPFEEYIAPLAERWSRYDLSVLRRGASRRYDLAGNWKLAVENFIDYYHLPSVHKGLNSYSHMQDHYTVSGDTFFGQGNARLAIADALVGRFPSFPGLTDEEQTITEAFCLFPNLLITIFNDNLRIIHVEPRGATACHERVEVFFIGDEAATDPDLSGDREGLVDRFEQFNVEDIAIVEGLQRAFESTAFDGGRLSPTFDANIHRFHLLLAAATVGADDVPA